MDSQVPEAFGRRPDRHTSRDSDLPRRKLNLQDAARFLGLSVSTLNKLRLTGNGPPYMKPKLKKEISDVALTEPYSV
jgi:hypothetical protein